MVKKYYILLDFISTDEDPGLRIESFAIIKLRGVSTKLNIIVLRVVIINNERQQRK